jgi:Tfp pilus assembly protein PilF
MFTEKHINIIICSILALATLAVYAPMLFHPFINYDDSQYLLDNPHVATGLSIENIRWAFTSIYQANWHPLTWISHMLDVQLFGLGPFGHHLTSLLLHEINTLLLFIYLLQATGDRWRSACVAALFALHPLHVESVAWVAERKDLLSTLFFMTTLLAYSCYSRKPSISGYLTTLGSFALGLMCKPMLVTLPFLLLLLDFWPLNRFSREPLHRLTVEKLPFLALTAASCWVTYIAQQTGVFNPSLPLALKLANSLTAYVTYLIKMLWPARLAILYPFNHEILPWKVIAAGAFLLVLTVLVMRKGRSHPYLPVGWFWYLGTLVPVIGLVNIGYQATADRYTYIPLIGIFIMVVWLGADAVAGRQGRKATLVIAAAVILICLAITSRWQLGFWQSSSTLFARTIAVTRNNYVACNNLGAALQLEGKLDEAMVAYEASLAIKPSQAPPHNNIGLILAAQGKLNEAVRYYTTALSLAPGYRDAGYNLGVALSRQGMLEDAVVQFARVINLKLGSNDQINRFATGLQLIKAGRYSEATAKFDEAIRVDPLNAKVYRELGSLLVRFGQ